MIFDLMAYYVILKITKGLNVIISDYEGGEIVFNDGQRFGMEHKLGVGIIHLGSLLHQVWFLDDVICLVKPYRYKISLIKHAWHLH